MLCMSIKLRTTEKNHFQIFFLQHIKSRWLIILTYRELRISRKRNETRVITWRVYSTDVRVLKYM